MYNTYRIHTRTGTSPAFPAAAALLQVLKVAKRIDFASDPCYLVRTHDNKLEPPSPSSPAFFFEYLYLFYIRVHTHIHTDVPIFPSVHTQLVYLRLYFLVLVTHTSQVPSPFDPRRISEALVHL